MKHGIIIIVFFLFTAASCSKNDAYVTKDALLNWTGDYAVDGCGFFVMIDGHTFKPDNESDIPDEFKSYGIPVRICCKETFKSVADGCYTVEPTFTDRIHVRSVRKR